MDLSKIALVAAAAELGSLSAVARRHGARLSTISRQVADIEREVGAALLVRTGRGVRPTPAGERFLERARHALRELESAVAEARGEAATQATHLRIAAPLEMALSLLPPCLAELHREHPEVVLDLHSEARRVSLLEEEYDAALRLGELADSSLLGRRLGAIGLVLCAGLGLPPLAEGDPLAGLGVLHWVGVAGVLELVRGRIEGREFTLAIAPRLRVTTFSEAAELAALAGLAVLLPIYTAERYLIAGRLRLLAPHLELPRVTAHMILAPRHRENPALTRLTALIRGRLAGYAASAAAGLGDRRAT